jgi:DNA polymerase-3 subunit epsilon
VIEELINQADLIVAHHAEFDLGFVNRELAALGRPPVAPRVYCTMEGYRRMNPGGPASLSAIAGHCGFARCSEHHSALEDAWLAMMIFLWQHGCPHRIDFDVFTDREPANIQPVPPIPDGPLPRRRRRRARR